MDGLSLCAIRLHSDHMQPPISISNASDRANRLPFTAIAQFGVGDVVRHRLFDFRGVIFDIDPVFSNSDEWYDAIPAEIKPAKDQPFYHLFAENGESSYVAYVSQQNLVGDGVSGPVDHPSIDGMFNAYTDGRYPLRAVHRH
ncbi:MAG: heat shock protein HspQ [Sphingopyxis sp.]